MGEEFLFGMMEMFRKWIVVMVIQHGNVLNATKLCS